MVALPGPSRSASLQKELVMFVFRRFAQPPFALHFWRSNLHVAGKCRSALIAIALVCAAHNGRAQSSPKVEFGSSSLGQDGDHAAAERILGPQWRDIARRAGIIFVGTVIANNQPRNPSDSFGPMHSSIEITFSVERGIAGAESGRSLTIHEWAGAERRVMRRGQHYLLLLYQPSRLGFTSAVGGTLGEVLLDAAGKNVAEAKPMTNVASLAATGLSFQPPGSSTTAIQVNQLERAIRNARSAQTN